MKGVSARNDQSVRCDAYDFSDSLARIFRRFKDGHVVVTSAGKVIGKTAIEGFLRIGGKAHTAYAVA